jgi:hypothetical protein
VTLLPVMGEIGSGMMSKELRQSVLRIFALAVDATGRAILVIFGIIVVLLAAAALFAAATNAPPSWLPNARLLDVGLLTALGSLLLGLSGLYIGGRLRKYQEMEAKARARLALNVSLRTRVVGAVGDRIVEVIIDVHNVSRTTWFVPMVYLFVRSALGDQREIPLNRRHCNLADYTAALCQLQPDENDQLFTTVVFTPTQSMSTPAVIVRAEIVGTSERWLGPHREKMAFIEFMAEDSGARHDYHCIGRCDDKNHKWYGRRMFANPDGSMDEVATGRYRGFLDDVMLWSRETVVSLSEESEGIEEASSGVVVGDKSHRVKSHNPAAPAAG